LEHVCEVPSTCSKKGVAEHYKCSVCEKLFTDNAGANETNLKALELDFAAHTPGSDHICTVCNQFAVDAKINDTYYDTLVEAVAAANDGDTITLLRDQPDGNGIIIPADKFTSKGLTIDFNGKCYTVDRNLAGSDGSQNQCFQILGSKDSDGVYSGNGNTKVTLKNGTIMADNSDILFLIQNYSDLTLDNMILDASTMTLKRGKISYSLSNNFGTTTLKNKTTFKEGHSSWVPVDVLYGFQDYKSVSLLIEDSSVVLNGKIAYGFDTKVSTNSLDMMKSNSSIRIPTGYSQEIRLGVGMKFNWEWIKDTNNEGYLVLNVSPKE
jgi:hypothetical protein